MELITTNPDWFDKALNTEHKSKFVEVNGARIEYMEWGNPENQSVIMLHGTNAHAHWFKFIGAILSDKYHFVVMSFSGMGGSDWRSFYTRDTFVDDVWGVVNDAGMENPLIVGHSFGGMVSLITASKHSSEMAGLLLVDFVVYTPEEHHEWKAYGQSKTAASLLAVEISNKMKNEGIKTYSVHPGGIFTPLQRHLEKEEMIALGWLGEDGELSEMAAANFKSTTQGAATSLWCATSPMLNDVSGVYCENCDVAARQEDGPMARYIGVADWAVDTDEASKLWELTEHTLASLG